MPAMNIEWELDAQMKRTGRWRPTQFRYQLPGDQRVPSNRVAHPFWAQTPPLVRNSLIGR